jgi:hypothetical protein
VPEQSTAKKKNTDSVNTTSIDYKTMLFCVLHHPMDAETHNLPGEKFEKFFSGQKPAHRQGYRSDTI